MLNDTFIKNGANIRHSKCKMGGKKNMALPYGRFKEPEESDVFVLCPIVWSVIAAL